MNYYHWVNNDNQKDLLMFENWVITLLASLWLDNTHHQPELGNSQKRTKTIQDEKDCI